MTVVEQAGGIVFRRERAGISILLVRAKRDPSAWIFPKGHIEPGETARATAVRETREEAGVHGEAIGEIGDPQEFEWAGRWYRVQYFLMRMTSESDETDGREKAWFPFDEALDRVSFESARALLHQARKRIEALES
ncbi:MAG TPA: NUDIX domain-containing protein [Vicinamibacterales bacterium]|nr:NUDIX domain-containing protein [Vicinamibacterales bacterium]